MFEPQHEKTCFFAYAKTKPQISAFVFDLHLCFRYMDSTVQSLYFCKLKFQASTHLLWLYSLWFVSDLVGNPGQVFS